MKSVTMLSLALCAMAVAQPAAASEPSQQAKVCSTLGKVHAQRDRQLYAVSLQSIDGKLSAHRGDSCITLSPGEHQIGMTSGTEAAAFPRRRQPQGALKEQFLKLQVEPRRTYTVAAQLDDRYEASWIPVVQRVELWDQDGAL